MPLVRSASDADRGIVVDESRGALAGITVIEFTSDVPGGYCGRLPTTPRSDRHPTSVSEG